MKTIAPPIARWMGSGAGIRTPINGSKIRCPAIRRRRNKAERSDLASFDGAAYVNAPQTQPGVFGRNFRAHGRSIAPMARRSVESADARARCIACEGPHRAGCDHVPFADDAEARLVERLVQRDERAFNALVRAHEARVFGLLLQMIGSRAEAEDLAQEVFVQVFKAIGAFRGESKLSTWIYRIAVNLSKNRGKYLRVRHSGQEDDFAAMDERVDVGNAKRAAVGSVARPDDMAAGKQLERIVQHAILQLEPTFRECLVLRDIEDLSYEEIEAITGLPEGTVKSRIHRARGQLRELVERELGEKIA
jgi:RNA polymerase sigma-70 factor, ECF subfamily